MNRSKANVIKGHSSRGRALNSGGPQQTSSMEDTRTEEGTHGIGLRSSGVKRSIAAVAPDEEEDDGF